MQGSVQEKRQLPFTQPTWPTYRNVVADVENTPHQMNEFNVPHALSSGKDWAELK